jgi:NADP-dependent 3-hydroxy acid dehydrogenase YdfG
MTANVKTAIITGASSGIGQACAEIFAKGNWNIVVTARRIEKLDELKKRLMQQYPIQVFTLELDVRKSDSGNTLAAFIAQHQLNPDLLINNAGLASGLDPIHKGQADDWEAMIDTNLKGLLYITRAISPLMVERRSGHIINIGSIAGKEAYANGNVYCATKHAVDGLTKAMRLDLVSFGIRVTQIAPGAAETEFSQVRFHGDNQRAENVYKGYIPLKAIDIADAIWYCANVPTHVNINDLVIMPTAQAAATVIHKIL